MCHTKMGGRTLVDVILCDNRGEDLTILGEMIGEIWKNRVRIRECYNYFELQTLLFDEIGRKIDILFMNVKIGNNIGIDVAKQIQSIYPDIQIVFISESADYARLIFQADPSYFLLKPIKQEEIMEALKRLITQQKTKKQKVFMLETKKGIYSLLIESIRYIESEKRVIRFFLTEERVESEYGKMNEIEEKLPYQFLRCHQSYIVNMNKIKFFSGKEIVLDNNVTLPISRPKYKQVKDKLMQYLSNDQVQNNIDFHENF